ncbi:MAG: ABC transporter ATP-binding protein [Bacteroidales bacterium]|nr:ABC transporter ATP-binding protein [Bacteroidales bacterium]
MKELLRFLRPHLLLTILSPVFVTVEVVAELIQPDIMSGIVNEGVLGGNTSIILPEGIKMLIITLVGMLGGVLSIIAAGHVAYSFGADMRSAVFRKISYLSFSSIDNLQTGSLITRMTSDVSRVQSVIQASMRLLYRAPFMFIGAIFMVLSIDLGISSILLILLPILTFSIIFILKKSFPLFMVVQQRTDRLNTVVQETLAGVRVIKAYGQEEREKKRFAQANNDLIETNLKVSRRIILLGPVMSLILNIGIAVIVYYGARLVEAQSINVGDIMACTNYLTQILMSLMMASHVIMSMTEAKASLSRINEVLLTENNIAQSAGNKAFAPSANAIQFDNVSFKYDPNSASYTLRNISFGIGSGQTIAIVGGTGSGKSTLALLMARFYDATEGRISISGTDINKLSTNELRRHVGIVMQQSFLFSGTIADNLRWGRPDATDDDIICACKQAQIYDFVQSLPDGINQQVSQQGVNLSGGQRQRLAIARTLIGRPDILILDDCLSAVDLKTEALLRQTLKELPATKVIIAQRISTIKDADLILILENGELVDQGTHDKLLQRCGIYREICESQQSV